jgi:hypothetical protein
MTTGSQHRANRQHRQKSGQSGLMRSSRGEEARDEAGAAV